MIKLFSLKKKNSECFSPSTRAATLSSVSDQSDFCIGSSRASMKKPFSKSINGLTFASLNGYHDKVKSWRLFEQNTLTTEENQSSTINERNSLSSRCECENLINRLKKLSENKIFLEQKISQKKKKNLNLEILSVSTKLRENLNQLLEKKSKNSALFKDNQSKNIVQITESHIQKEISGKINSIKDEIEKMKFDIEKKNRENQIINKNIVELAAELEQEKQQCKTTSRDINNLIEDNKSLSTSLVILNKKTEKLKEQLNNLIKKYLKYKTELILVTNNLS